MEDSRLLDLMETAERLEAVADALEESAQRLAEQQEARAVLAHAEAAQAEMDAKHEESSTALGPIVATVATERELELERRLAEAEAHIAALSASAAAPAAADRSGRKTLSAGTATLLARQGVSVEASATSGTLSGGALDAALSPLSIEQRFAVKAELLRSGLLG